MAVLEVTDKPNCPAMQNSQAILDIERLQIRPFAAVPLANAGWQLMTRPTASSGQE